MIRKNNVKDAARIVAVSGGVDSVVMLHMLMQDPQSRLIVAHFDHGIRDNSSLDVEYVRKLAAKYRLEFETKQGKLGSLASEAMARKARYEFLHAVRLKYGATDIITGHHQDDYIETALLNLLRGTGRRGLTSVAQNTIISRPLLAMAKHEILTYASKHNLQWREDPSNNDIKYLRNYVRKRIMPKYAPSSEARNKMVVLLRNLEVSNTLLNAELTLLTTRLTNNGHLNRFKFIMLPHAVAKELLMHWLREQGVRSFNAKTIERLATTIKTGRVNSVHEVENNFRLLVTRRSVQLTDRSQGAPGILCIQKVREVNGE